MDKLTTVDGRDTGTTFCRNYYFLVDGRGWVKAHQTRHKNGHIAPGEKGQSFLLDLRLHSLTLYSQLT